MIFEKLCDLISEQFSVEADTITMETTFEELGADSLELLYGDGGGLWLYDPCAPPQ